MNQVTLSGKRMDSRLRGNDKLPYVEFTLMRSEQWRLIMSKLAIDGGEKVRTKPFPPWPVWDESELNALKEVLESGQWGTSGFC